MDGDRAEGDQAGPASSVTATPTAAQTTPNEMSNLQHVVTGVIGGSGGQVKFTWNDPGDSQIDKYQYRYDASASNPESWDVDWTDIPSSAGDTVSWGPFNIPVPSAILFYQFSAVNHEDDDGFANDVNMSFGPAAAVSVSRSNTPGTSPEPPVAPTGLSATPGVQQVILSWTDPSNSDITKYQVRKSTDGGTSFDEWADITGSVATTTSHDVTSLTNGTSYTFELRAVEGAGTAEDPFVYGAAAQAEAATPGAPNAPATLSAVGGDKQVTLTWTAGADITSVIVTGFKYRKRASEDANWGEWTDIEGSDDSTVTHTVTGLDVGKAYEFQVRAVSGSGESQIGSQASNTASATTITPPPPLKPGGLTATAGDDSVTLTWTSPGDLTIDKYRYRQTTTSTDSGGTTVGDFSAAPWLLIEGSGSGTSEHEVTGLTVGTLYHFKIQAASPYGDSPDSDTVFAKPLPVRGEWTFDAVIRPDTIESGSDSGADVFFTATYTVTGGEPTDLSPEVTANGLVQIGTTFSQDDGGNIGRGASTDSLSQAADVASLEATRCEPDLSAGTITCEWSTLTVGQKLFAKTNTAPGTYDVVDLQLSKATTFTAKASTADHSDFTSAAVTLTTADTFTPQLNVISGLPAAPTGLTTAPGNSRVDLTWDDPGNPNITGYEYQQTTTAPGVTLKSTAGGSDAAAYQYRQTTTEPGITVTWEDPQVAGTTNYEYRQTTATTTDAENNTIGDFTSATWNEITGSDADTTSYKFTVDDITTLDLTKTYYFEVRPYTDGTENPVVTLTGRTVEYFSDPGTEDDWSDIPESSVGEANEASYKVTELDLRIPHYFEVRVHEVQVGSTIIPTATATLTWEDPGNDDITKWQFRHSTHGNFKSDGSDWTDIDPSDKSTTSYTPTVDLSTANYYQIRPFTDAGLDPVTFTIAAALSWSDPLESTIERFQYRDSTDGGNTWSVWADIDSSSATTTSHTVEDIDLSTPHAFEVRGVKEQNGNPVTVQPRLGDVDNFNRETWVPIPNSARGEANAVSYTVIGLGNNVTYYFRIRADTTKTVDGDTVGGPGGVSNTKSATTMLAAPVAPTGLTATPSSSVTEVKLLWTDPGDSDITGWEYRYTSAWQAVLTWDVDAAATGWEYHHSVDGGNNYGEWKDSDIIEADAATATTATITGVNRALSNMFEVRPVKAGGDQPAVTTGQTISGDFTGIDTWTTITESSATTTEHTVPGLDLNNNFYFFEVRPVRGEVSGDVVDLNQEQQLGSVTLSWDDPGDSTITKYQYHLTETKISGTSETVVGPSEWLDIPEKGKVTGLKALEHDYTGSSGLVSEYDFVYTIKIRAVNNSGHMGAEASGPESAEVKANPGLPLAAPKNVTASYNPATGAFTIGWDAYNSALFKPDFEVLGTGPDGVSLRATAVTVLGDSPVIPDSVEIVTDLFGDFTFVVRAREDFGPWAESDTVEATASPFAEASLTREVGDTAAAGANVGKPVTVAATGYDVSYSLKGDSGRIFSINRDTGQITLTGNAPDPGA